jgi:hypothetical protein
MNKVRKLGRALVWVLLGLFLVSMVWTVLKLGLVIFLLAFDTGQRGRASIAGADPETFGRLIGNITGQCIALLVIGFLWLKVLRWLRRPVVVPLNQRS